MTQPAQVKTPMVSSQVARVALAARLAAAAEPDMPAALAAVIKAAIEAEADPYVMTGIMVEGITHILSACVPMERHPTAAAATLTLLADRMAARGLI